MSSLQIDNNLTFPMPSNSQGILSFISIQFKRSLIIIFLDFFQNKIIDDKSKDGAEW